MIPRQILNSRALSLALICLIFITKSHGKPDGTQQEDDIIKLLKDPEAKPIEPEKVVKLLEDVRDEDLDQDSDNGDDSNGEYDENRITYRWILSISELNYYNCFSDNLIATEKALELIKDKPALSSYVEFYKPNFIKYCANRIAEEFEKHKDKRLEFFWRPLNQLRKIFLNHIKSIGKLHTENDPSGQNSMDIDNESNENQLPAHLLLNEYRLVDALAIFMMNSNPDPNSIPSIDAIKEQLLRLGYDFRSLVDCLKYELIALGSLERISSESLAKLPIELQVSLVELKITEMIQLDESLIYDLRRLIEIGNKHIGADVQPFIYYSGLPYDELLALYRKLHEPNGELKNWSDVWMILRWLLVSPEAKHALNGSSNPVKSQLDEAVLLERISKVSAQNCYTNEMREYSEIVESITNRTGPIKEYVNHFKVEQVDLCLKYLADRIEKFLKSSWINFGSFNDLISIFMRKVGSTSGQVLYKRLNPLFTEVLNDFISDHEVSGCDIIMDLKESIRREVSKYDDHIIDILSENLETILKVDLEVLKQAEVSVQKSFVALNLLKLLNDPFNYNEITTDNEKQCRIS